MDRQELRRLVLTLGIVLLAVSHEPLACNVPAFRYALERWPADPYQIVVYHESVLRGEEFELLQKSAAGRDGPANYSIETIDVRKPQGKVIADQRRIKAYPWVEIYYPVNAEVRGPAWSGALTSGRAKKIIQSPSRSGIAQKLLSGDVAVWVLVKSGHESKDRRALESLKMSLERASATLRIPEIGTDLSGNPIAVNEYKTYPVHFALMEIARDNPDEDILVGALLQSEPDLEAYDEPMAFPVFGRGRVLYALVGAGIQEKTILEACQSLVNWCSCEIKAESPGTDLLVSADWSKPYGGKMVTDPDLPLTGLDGFIEDQAEAEAAKADPKAGPAKPAPVLCEVPATPTRVASPGPGSGQRSAGGDPINAADDPGSNGALLRNLLYLAGTAGLVLLALSVVLWVKKRS